MLSNQKIDLKSLTVNVLENNGSSNTLFNRVDILFGLSNTSNIYFVQASHNNLYELVFGDGYLGRIPQNGAVVNVNYRITSGPSADGISSFQLSQELDTINGGRVNVSSITTVANSSSGSIAETIENIRFRAPRWYAAQQRGVSNDDYKSLIYSQFGSYIQDINVFGGQDDTPYKQYGTVIVSIKPYGGTTIPDYLKSQITNYMLDKSQMKLVLRDPDYLYLRTDSTVQYDKTKTSLYVSDLQNLIRSTISNYSYNNLEHFNSDFRYSRFVSSIDNTDVSIVSNQTDIYLIKRISPLLNYATSYTYSYNNAADTEPKNASIGYTTYGQLKDEPVLTSSAFTYVDSNGLTYPLSYMRDDNIGNIIVYTDINNQFTILNSNLGTIDYTTGDVSINNLLVSSYNQYISIYMEPLNKDVIIDKNKILIIDPNDVTVNVIEVLV